MRNFYLQLKIKSSLKKNSNLNKNIKYKILIKNVYINYFNMCLKTGKRRGVLKKLGLSRLELIKNNNFGNLTNFNSADW